MMDKAYHREEQLNALSHGFGIILGLVGFYIMWNHGRGLAEFSNFSIAVYSLSIILLFTASTLYHSVHVKDLKSKLRILDHISIYYLIAGTYTPVALITLLSGNGWLIFYLVWGLALAGTVLKIFFTGKFEIFSLLLYLIMGWMIIFDIGNLVAISSDMGLFLLFLGGAFYTLGIVFYVVRKIPFNHAIWHLFVLGGAISHWLYIFYYVI